MKTEYNLDIRLFSAWGRLDGVRWQYKEMAEILIKKVPGLFGQSQFSITIAMVGNFQDTMLIILLGETAVLREQAHFWSHLRDSKVNIKTTSQFCSFCKISRKIEKSLSYHGELVLLPLAHFLLCHF